MFANREEAGRLLGNALLGFRGSGTIVLAIPGGGVPVGAEVARILQAPLDVVVARKIGAPQNQEFAVGAVTQDGRVIADAGLLEELHISSEYMDEQAAALRQRIRSSLLKYRGGRPYPQLGGLTALVVDDGMATGSTMKAAVLSVRSMGARKVVAAVPVAPGSTVSEISNVADRVVCLMTPPSFQAVGDYYGEFGHVGDAGVKRVLSLSAAGTA